MPHVAKSTVSPVSLFSVYAQEDEDLYQELEQHLITLKQQHLIITQSDRHIVPGKDRRREIEIHLNNASIILLLISIHFLNSDACYGVEMKRALERHENGEAHVIPIILRPCSWDYESSLKMLQTLPMNAIPVTQWSDRSEAFVNIEAGIRRVVRELAGISHKQEQEEIQPKKCSA